MVKLFSEMKRDALCPPFRQHMLDIFHILMSLHTFYCSHLVFILWGQIFLKIALGRV